MRHLRQWASQGKKGSKAPLQEPQLLTEHSPKKDDNRQ